MALKLDSGFQPASLVDVLSWRAEKHGEKLAYAFLKDGEQDETSLSYAAVEQRAKAIATYLQQSGAEGERALLLFPPGLEYVTAFYGCLYAGVVAVPAYPPRLNRPAPRLRSIVQDAQPKFALAEARILASVERRFEHAPDLAGLHWLDTQTIDDKLADGWRDPGVIPEHLAFLQYTSGSTATPKGVRVSHGNLLHNMAMIAHGFGIDPEGMGVFWLPNYHDMGLIGGVLEPMYVGGSVCLFSPTAFLQRPIRWLRAITRYKGTISGAPNFAYQLCVDKITSEQKEGLDLSSWQIAFCGAEPVRRETLEAFGEAFADYGFRKEAFYPCYGLAEGTLLASGGHGPAAPASQRFATSALELNRANIAKPEESAKELVSCGNALMGQRVVIADPEAQVELPENVVGEIWVSGPSVALGYWNRPQQSRDTFEAYLKDSGEGPFLRTGDLGFIHEQELYITGRLKDLIIIRGRNHSPQDIELTVEKSHPAFEPGMGAAFSLEVGGEERLVVAHELARRSRRENVGEVTSAARQAISESHGLQPYAILLLKPLSIPKTSSGKVRRQACKQSFLEGALKVIGEWRAESVSGSEENGKDTLGEPKPTAAGQSIDFSSSEFREKLVSMLAEALKIKPSDVDISRPFAFYGLDSVQGVGLAGELETWLGRTLSPTLVWDYPTVAELADYLAGEEIDVARGQAASASDEPIAIIGLSCRFPGADDPESFWSNLRDGLDSISEIPPDRWDAESYYASPGEDGSSRPGTMSTRWGGFLERVDLFDPQAFGISPREAARMDPQQRLLLEVSWEALENAGIAPLDLAGSRTGVYFGISTYDYAQLQSGDVLGIDTYTGTGNAHSIAANRVSYVLDLRGPSMAVDTACSSSLVAVHQAIRSLRSGESEMALAGGVNVMLGPEPTVFLSQARAMAADGRCKTFDARADGYVRGEGCGVVVLKRLSQAQQDGDRVLAVIRGSAVNQDGRTNGLTAPNGRAQQMVIRDALADAGIHPADVSYVEAHGTGTPLGDPIEVQSLRAVYEEERPANKPLFLGSVKTNIGHLESAAGVAGLIKVILSLQQELLPPHLHFHELNPHISLDGSSIVITGVAQDWPANGQDRIAGISSFGFGGTNAHVIVAGAPVARAEDDSAHPMERSRHLLTLSARSRGALQQLAGRYSAYLAGQTSPSLPDICFTANTGRVHQRHRLAISASSVEELQRSLASLESGQIANNVRLASVKAGERPKVAFLFTGSGAQYPNMGKALYESQPVFRTSVDRCAAMTREQWGLDLLPVLFSNARSEAANGPIIHEFLEYSQTAIFVIEYALTEMWKSWGVTPEFVMGHSLGEYAAACAAGVFDLRSGLELVIRRARLMQSISQSGLIAAVMASAETVEPFLEVHDSQVVIGVHNGPESVAITGEAQAVRDVIDRLEREGIRATPLAIAQATHSPLLDPILEEYAAIAGEVEFKAPSIGYASNLTGELLPEGQIPDAYYWRDHMRQPVKFAQGIRTLHEQGVTTFLEVGPQPTLLALGQKVPQPAADEDASNGRGRELRWLPSLRKGRDDWQVLLRSLSELYVSGCEVDWAGFDRGYKRKKVALPTYPFERQRYWSGGGARSGRASARDGALPLFRTKPPTASGSDLSAAFQQVAIQAVQEVLGDGELNVESLTLAGSSLRGSSKRQEAGLWETLVIPESEDLASFQILSRNEDRKSWTVHASGKVRRVERTVVPGMIGVSEIGEQPLRSRVGDLGQDEQRHLILSWLRAATADVIGLDESSLDVRQPLDTLGFDSLMAVELRGRIEKELDTALPVVHLLEGPSVEGLAEQLANQLNSGAPNAERILPSENRQGFQPLSPNQQALWFLHELLPADLSFNVASAVSIYGKLHVEALEKALAEIVARHPALRTTFSVKGGRPRQQVEAVGSVRLERIDAVMWSDDDVRSFLSRHAYAPFDLENGPLMRVLLLDRSESERILMVALDHIVVDLWSLTVMFQELYAQYRAMIAESQLALPPLELQYSDYVHWQRSFLESEQGQRQKEYWLKELSGELPILNLPTDGPRPAVQTYGGDAVSLEIDRDLTERLRGLSHQQGATLYMTLLAAFHVLLHRYSGQEDIVVGSVLAGRDRPELAGVVGYLIKPVAVRANLGGDPSFAEFLAQVRGKVLGAIANQEFPLPLLANDLELSRDSSQPPVFQAMFIMQKAKQLQGQSLSAFAPGMPKAQLELDGLRVESLDIGGMPAQFDLTLMVSETEGGLALALHYNTALYNGSAMKQMLRHLRSLLGSFSLDQTLTVGSGSLLSPEEQNRLLEDWIDAEPLGLDDVCIHHLFEASVARAPKSVAAMSGAESLSYLELERRANQLAHFLQARGVGPNVLVGLCLDRSVDLLVGLLGVLKAGGAYVPLDPEFPAARLSAMLEDARPPVLIIHDELADRLVIDSYEPEIIRLDADWPSISAEAKDRPAAAAGPDDLAYVIYTSGSTGKPKGVQIEHRSVVNFLYSMTDTPGMTADDVLLAVTTLSFDIAVLELFLPLSVGARVAIATRGDAVDGQLLDKLLQESGASVMQATPASWRMLVDSGWRGKPDLKMLCGGEALPADLAGTLLERGAELWNLYGPTETTIWSTVHRVHSSEVPISIGRPIRNTRTLVLDRNMAPVPVGVVGELYIGGSGVARGYLNRPELTRERFVADPYDGEEGGRLYRTGDLARYRDDGTIIYLGREDSQVKIRGYRIELGEIEATLARFQGMQQNVVVAKPDRMGGSRLVAYLVMDVAGNEPPTAEIRGFLRQWLPEYMVPSIFVTLGAFPLTPNGKIDRKALPEPPEGRPELQFSFVAPRTSLEMRLAKLAAESLQIKRVGVHDNFFELGGNSLSAARLIYQVREELEADIPLRHLFASPTIAELAKAVEQFREHGQPVGDDGQGLFGAITLEELNAEATLDSAIQAGNLPLAAVTEPANILLTGGTGFVGAYLIRDLIRQSQAVIHCLVRAESAEAGVRRLRQNLETYGLWEEDFATRLAPVPGDLSHRRLGLSAERHAELTKLVDVVYHNGAMVNFVYPFALFRGPNVYGTEEVMRFAATSRLKSVHLVSTLSVLHNGEADEGQTYYENMRLDEAGVPFGGYAQSKWVAEKLTRQAMERGIPAAIYRPGLVSGDSRTGAWNTADIMTNMARVSLLLSAVPDLDVMVDVVPVDYVSSAIVRMSLSDDFEGKVYHLNNPERLPYVEMIHWANGAGLDLELVSFDEWRRRLVDLNSGFGNGSGNPFIPLLEEANAGQVYMPAIDCRNTLQALAASGIECEPVGPRLLQTYLSHLTGTGFLPARDRT